MADSLVPRKFGRIRSNFLCEWREQKLNSILDHGSENFSIYLPESLRVLKECFLKIELPANAAALKDFPGLHIIKTIRLMSAGQECYTCNYFQHLCDHMQQMKEEDVEQFGRTYLGKLAAASGAARVVMLPILLPNSPFLLRDGKDLRGHGIFPAYLDKTDLRFS